jgi:hypothetical protein
VSDLRAALDNAKAQASSRQDLDDAYELIGIAEEANRGGDTAIATDAVAAFTGVIERAASRARTASFADGQDTLDQLVDLTFFARTNDIVAAESVLRISLRQLFPELLGAARKALDATADWPQQVELLAAIGEMQAAAARVKLDQEADDIGVIFDAETAKRDPLVADQPERAKDIAELRRVRDEQLAEAIANNVDAVAEEMRSAVPDGSDGGEIGEAMPADLSFGDTSCIETGMLPPDDAPETWQAPTLMLKRLGDECVLSGREPRTDRCDTRNLVFVCQVPGRESERITYVYRNTPEETYMRRACEGAVIEAAKLPTSGPQFLNAASRLVFTCGPVNDTSSPGQ